VQAHAEHILAIEISNPGSGSGMDARGVRSGSSVAIGRIGGGKAELIDVEWLHATPVGQRGGIDDDLMPALDRLFVRIGVQPREALRAGRVAVSIGPGGYTSLRIACAAGKMIAEASGAGCVCVPTAAALARAARREGQTGPLGIVLASKGESAWVQVLDEHGRGEPGSVISPEKIRGVAQAGVRTLVADQHFPKSMRAEAQACGLNVIEPIFDASIVLELGAELNTCDPLELNPLYPREPDAVTLWRARKSL
jgi:tRNA threonylcarbamoyladenosine biosynthesis protein TsaB